MKPVVSIPEDAPDDVTETINRVCEENDPRDEFSAEAARRVLENVEW